MSFRDCCLSRNDCCDLADQHGNRIYSYPIAYFAEKCLHVQNLNAYWARDVLRGILETHINEVVCVDVKLERLTLSVTPGKK